MISKWYFDLEFKWAKDLPDIYVWNDRKIQVNAIDILDTLYDLIKTDLVEKVNE